MFSQDLLNRTEELLVILMIFWLNNWILYVVQCDFHIKLVLDAHWLFAIFSRNFCLELFDLLQNLAIEVDSSILEFSFMCVNSNDNSLVVLYDDYWAAAVSYFCVHWVCHIFFAWLDSTCESLPNIFWLL